MRAFSSLFARLDQTTSTNAKVEAMAAYLRAAPASDAAWGLFFLSGLKIKRLIPSGELASWARQVAGVSPWLFDECYVAVGDLAETVALLVARRGEDSPLTPTRTDAGTGLASVAARRPATPRPAAPATLWDLRDDDHGAGSHEAGVRASHQSAHDSISNRAESSGASDAAQDRSLTSWIIDRVLPLRGLDASEQRRHMLAWWGELSEREVFLLVKLVTGSLRVGVSRTLVERAVAQAAGIDPDLAAERLAGAWEPSAAFFRDLMRPAEPRHASPHADAKHHAGEAGGDEPPQNLGDDQHTPLEGEPTAGQSPDPSRSLSSAARTRRARSDAALRPYPFFLASPLDGSPESLGPLSDWLAEWKWDGIRAQLIRRRGQVGIWSRGDERLTDRFPEVLDAAARLRDDVVIDGELLAFAEGRPLPFSVMQRRIGRQSLGPRVLRAAPVVFIAYDLIELHGQDLRNQPLRQRRNLLAKRLEGLSSRIVLSPSVDAESWTALAALRRQSRERGVEGLMLKRWDSPYGVGRRRGEWWKWKVDPFSVDAVLVYAQPGHGRRASLLTDYTFAVWTTPGGDVGGFQGESPQGVVDESRAARRVLTPFAKAYSGLDQDEIARLDAWIRQHTTERFGPVRAVRPEQVFEIAFEGVQRSPRHASGVALRFPRIARWRTDKKPEEADTLDALLDILRSIEGDARAAERDSDVLGE